MPAFGKGLNGDQVAALGRLIDENQTAEHEPVRVYGPSSTNSPSEFE